MTDTTSSSSSSSSPSPSPSLHRVSNFNAGPAALPLSVLSTIGSELFDYGGSGMSIMEMSHRSKTFEKVLSTTINDIRAVLSIPSSYKILLMQGGGTGQFASIPLNLLGKKKKAAYLITGSWSKAAAAEAKKYCEVIQINDSEGIEEEKENNNNNNNNANANPSLDPTDIAYFYYCSNETVDGVEIRSPSSLPSFPSSIPLICDMSSNFCSLPIIDWNRFAVVYAGAQKNVGPSGVTIVIIRDDLLYLARADTPTILDYKLMAEKDSMYNTPPCFSIYVVGLVMKWLRKEKRGLEGMEKENIEKASLIYSILDDPKYSSIYRSKIKNPHRRSRMNITFLIGNNDEKLLKQFVADAEKNNFIGLAGHRSVGGVRVSLYNAVGIENTKRLAEWMKVWADQLIEKQKANL